MGDLSLLDCWGKEGKAAEVAIQAVNMTYSPVLHFHGYNGQTSNDSYVAGDISFKFNLFRHYPIASTHHMYKLRKISLLFERPQDFLDMVQRRDSLGGDRLSIPRTTSALGRCPLLFFFIFFVSNSLPARAFGCSGLHSLNRVQKHEGVTVALLLLLLLAFLRLLLLEPGSVDISEKLDGLCRRRQVFLLVVYFIVVVRVTGALGSS